VSKATRWQQADDFTVAAALYDPAKGQPETSAQLQQAALKLADTPKPVQGGNRLGPQLLGGTAGLLQFLAPLVIKAFVPLPF